MEAYLEAILMLQEEKRPATVTQISQMLGVKMPSVVYALRKLSGQGLVEYERRGPIGLTAEGAELAADVFRRHEALRRFSTEYWMWILM